MYSIISDALIALGILTLIASLFNVSRILRRLPLGSSRFAWVVMTGLIVLFVIGYAAYIGIFWNKQKDLLDLVVPAVFSFGAMFVWFSTALALQTALDVMRVSLLEHETQTDPLTGMYNRRFLEQHLPIEFAKAKRYQMDLAVMMLDLDHFKSINDLHGHQVGDQILVGMANLLGDALRNSDLLIRYGGEEFMVIVPNTAPQSVQLVAERIRVCIASHSFKTGSQEQSLEISVTVSIGIANHSDSIASPEDLIRIADENLYRAKHEGRNQVVTDIPG